MSSSLAAWGVAWVVVALTSTIHPSGLVDGAGKAGGGPRLRPVGKEGEGGWGGVRGTGGPGVGSYSLAVGGWQRQWLPLPLPHVRLDWLMGRERLKAGRGHGLRARRVRVGGACSCCRGGTD